MWPDVTLSSPTSSAKTASSAAQSTTIRAIWSIFGTGLAKSISTISPATPAMKVAMRRFGSRRKDTVLSLVCRHSAKPYLECNRLTNRRQDQQQHDRDNSHGAQRVLGEQAGEGRGRPRQVSFGGINLLADQRPLGRKIC